ncbi:MAG: hypothetical protein WBG58_07905, partial [Ignavibacteriaceae bacterium]
MVTNSNGGQSYDGPTHWMWLYSPTRKISVDYPDKAFIISLTWPSVAIECTEKIQYGTNCWRVFITST